MAAEKTALVLSAGGMFGAYQAGVWKALEQRIRLDMVVGASVGALNGWLIASGCTGEELARRWLHPSAGEGLKLRGGRFDVAALAAQTSRLARESSPQIEFGVVVLELPRLRSVLVRHPDVTAEHLLATCSIPLMLPPVTIAGRRYVDGGFLEKLPVWAAIEMGATRIIAVDALPPFSNFWVRAAMRWIRFFRPRRSVPAGIEVTAITPSEPLGSVRDAGVWKRENAERWIELGHRDGERFIAAHYPFPAS